MFASTLLAASILAPAALPTVPAPDVKENVQKGLKWLVEQQTKEGNWAGRADAFKVQTTAYAGLALLMQGSTLKDGPYAENLRRAVAWMESIQGENGLLAIPTEMIEYTQYIPTHALALLFLVSAYDVDDDGPRRQKLAKVLLAGVEFAAESRTSRGGWGRVAPRGLGGEFDETQVTANMLHALFLIERAGLEVPKTLFQKGVKYLVDSTSGDGGVGFSRATGTAGQAVPSALTAMALCSVSPRPVKYPGWVACANRLMFGIPTGNQVNANSTNSNVMQQYLTFARLANALGDEGHQRLSPEAQGTALLRWSPYREKLYTLLKTTQKADGNWEDASIGHTFTSAIALIILQLDNNYIPALSR